MASTGFACGVSWSSISERAASACFEDESAHFPCRLTADADSTRAALSSVPGGPSPSFCMYAVLRLNHERWLLSPPPPPGLFPYPSARESTEL